VYYVKALALNSAGLLSAHGDVLVVVPGAIAPAAPIAPAAVGDHYGTPPPRGATRVTVRVRLRIALISFLCSLISVLLFAHFFSLFSFLFFAQVGVRLRIAPGWSDGSGCAVTHTSLLRAHADAAGALGTAVVVAQRSGASSEVRSLFLSFAPILSCAHILLLPTLLS
jgi:hypothetical protein